MGMMLKLSCSVSLQHDVPPPPLFSLSLAPSNPFLVLYSWLKVYCILIYFDDSIYTANFCRLYWGFLTNWSLYDM